MRMLMLLRHGKSDWSASEDSGWVPGADHRRPLAPRGIKAAKRIGRFIASADIKPDRILSSTATRARSTAELAIEAGDFAGELTLHDELYEASVADALAVIHATDESVERLLVAGHEPTTSSRASTRMGGGHRRVDTATLVGLAFYGPWNELGAGSAELRFLIPPRLLD
ncbi:MAG: histidine phosphatase family protein [Acidobacteriota bacterium]